MKNLPVLAALLAAALLGGCAAQSAASASAAPAETAAPEATAAPTPEPTPAANPLTGETDADYAGQRPVAVALRTVTGSTPWWGVSSADVLVEGVTEGTAPSLLALYASADEIGKAGPVGPGRDLLLQIALPLNAVPVHIGKNVYASNLLNTLSYQDVDGLHVGKTAFAFDEEREDAGYNEENCWYTSGDLIRAGLDVYGDSAEGENGPLFRFGTREAAAEGERTGTELTVTFSADDSETFVFDADSGLYTWYNTDGDAVTDADNGETAAFTNVLVLYASSGIKDDGYTRQYDMTGGDGLYLTGGAWEQIEWSKQDATGPLELTDADGEPLIVAAGKSFVAIWGGYYGQALALWDENGEEQDLPAKPELLESGISDEDAAAAEAEFLLAQQVVDAQAELDQALLDLEFAEGYLSEAQETLAAAEDDEAKAAAQADLDEKQAAVDELNARIEELEAFLAENAPAESEDTEEDAESEESEESEESGKAEETAEPEAESTDAETDAEEAPAE